MSDLRTSNEQTSVAENESAEQAEDNGFNHEGHDGARRKPFAIRPSCNFVTFVVYELELPARDVVDDAGLSLLLD
jgi:hypothetical protein